MALPGRFNCYYYRFLVISFLVFGFTRRLHHYGHLAEAVSDAKKENDGVPLQQDPEYLIVGAGGSGIQTALFLERYRHSYVILEKESTVGSFWLRFPAFGELISVNKRVRNETQRLRFDWHSMLETDVTMENVTTEYFPQGTDWHEYMSRVAKEANLKIEFNATVDRLAADGTPCVYLRSGDRRCAKKRVFVGTGLREKDEPYLRSIGGIPYSIVTKDMARDKRVCVLGNGNSGFEVAENVLDVADRVTLYGRHPHRLSAVTRYTGDVRVKYLQALENFHGKLLDTVDYFVVKPVIKGFKNFTNEQVSNFQTGMQAVGLIEEYSCERLVLATGFESTVPGLRMETRFPETDDWYAWKKNGKIHFVGWLMHERDYRKGAGGFLSGYRYLIRNLIHHVRSVDFGVPYPYDVLTKEQVMQRALSRFQTADDLVILQDGVVIKDVVIKATGETDSYHYYSGITYEFHRDIFAQEQRQQDEEDASLSMGLYFAWGDGRKASRVFDSVIRFGTTRKLLNLFLHPVVQVGNLTRNVQEDTDMEWTRPLYATAVEKAVRTALDGDLSTFQPKKDFTYERELAEDLADDAERDYEPAGASFGIDEHVVRAMLAAAKSDGSPDQLRALSKAAAQWKPVLFEVATDPELLQSQQSGSQSVVLDSGFM